MLAVKTGYSEKTDSFLAGSEAVDNALKGQTASNASLVIIFHTARHNSLEISKGITTKLGSNVEIIGGYAVGIITNDYIGYSGYQVGVAIFMGNSSYFRPFIKLGLADNEEKTGHLLAQDIEPFLPEISGMLLFYDSVNRINPKFKLNMATPLLKGMNDQWHGKWPILAGAGLVGDMQCGETFQLFGRSIYQQSAIALALCPPLLMDTTIIHGCTPIGSYHTITKTDHNTILEINNEPALDAISKLLGTTDKTWKEYAFFLTLGVNKGEKWKEYNEELYVNRLCLKVDERRKGIVMFEPDLKAGDEIQLMQRQVDLSDIKNKCKNLIDSLEGRKPIFAFYINCAGRAGAYCGMDEEDATAIQEALGNHIPLLGIYSGVEIAPIKKIPTPLDWTGVFCVISEQPNL